MTKITETLVRQKAEHNECQISTLEELSLHQLDIERIEHLDKWCRDLKILYLQSNLIPRIENVGRLKKLEYINLALNNVEKIENLEGCESLNKLDLTVNFVGELTSVESLCGLVHMNEIYLTGNPCTEYVGYRDYVVATLPQLKMLDGKEIEKSERIKAIQALPEIRGDIIRQQNIYRQKRELEKEEAESEKKQKNDKWYTDINTDGSQECPEFEGEEDGHIEKTEDEKDKEFWEEKVAFTPESRVKVHEYMQEKKKREERKVQGPDPAPREIRLQMEDGRMLNVNEAKIDFELWEDVKQNAIVLDVSIYRHLDTCLCDVDVQPTYVRVTIKGKVLQLVLTEEVRPDSSTAHRSQTTGHLLITMPKVKEVVEAQTKETVKSETNKSTRETNSRGEERLEVDPSSAKRVDLDIVKQNEEKLQPKVPLLGGGSRLSQVPLRENSPDFQDDPDVPPLM